MLRIEAFLYCLSLFLRALEVCSILAQSLLKSAEPIPFSTMRIAFDLDNTLIPYQNEFPTEIRNWHQRLFNTERLRYGTPALLKKIQREGHEVWIYTSSMRSAGHIRRTFRSYGLRLDGVINFQIHHKTLGARASQFSKFPPAFGIDLLVDDVPGIWDQLDRMGCEALIVSVQDLAWDKKVWKTICEIQAHRENYRTEQGKIIPLQSIAASAGRQTG